MKMTKKQVIEELRTIGAFFEEQSGAIPIAIEEAIRYLSAEKPQKNAKERYVRYAVVDRQTRAILTPFFANKKTARLALNSLEGQDIFGDCYEPDSYEIREIETEEEQ